jgi:hypothetical protein
VSQRTETPKSQNVRLASSLMKRGYPKVKRLQRRRSCHGRVCPGLKINQPKIAVAIIAPSGETSRASRTSPGEKPMGAAHAP